MDLTANVTQDLGYACQKLFPYRGKNLSLKFAKAYPYICSAALGPHSLGEDITEQLKAVVDELKSLSKDWSMLDQNRAESIAQQLMGLKNQIQAHD